MIADQHIAHLGVDLCALATLDGLHGNRMGLDEHDTSRHH